MNYKYVVIYTCTHILRIFKRVLPIFVTSHKNMVKAAPRLAFAVFGL